MKQRVAPEAVLDAIDPWLASAPLTDPVRRLVSERRDDAARALRCQQASLASGSGSLA